MTNNNNDPTPEQVSAALHAGPTYFLRVDIDGTEHRLRRVPHRLGSLAVVVLGGREYTATRSTGRRGEEEVKPRGADWERHGSIVTTSTSTTWVRTTTKRAGRKKREATLAASQS